MPNHIQYKYYIIHHNYSIMKKMIRQMRRAEIESKNLPKKEDKGKKELVDGSTKK